MMRQSGCGDKALTAVTGPATATAFARAPAGFECTCPPEGGAIGEGRLGLLSTTKEPVLPCKEPWEFDREFWNLGSLVPEVSVSGVYGGDITVSVNVPPVDKAGEEPYRDIKVYIPRPVSYDKDSVTITGDYRFVQTEKSDRIVQLRPDDAKGPVHLGGHIAVAFDGYGALTVTVPTVAKAEKCGTNDPLSPSCCPYWTSLPPWSAVYVGPLVLVQVQGLGYLLEVAQAN